MATIAKSRRGAIDMQLEQLKNTPPDNDQWMALAQQAVGDIKAAYGDNPDRWPDAVRRKVDAIFAVHLGQAQQRAPMPEEMLSKGPPQDMVGMPPGRRQIEPYLQDLQRRQQTYDETGVAPRPQVRAPGTTAGGGSSDRSTREQALDSAVAQIAGLDPNDPERQRLMAQINEDLDLLYYQTGKPVPEKIQRAMLGEGAAAGGNPMLSTLAELTGTSGLGGAGARPELESGKVNLYKSDAEANKQAELRGIRNEQANARGDVRAQMEQVVSAIESGQPAPDNAEAITDQFISFYGTNNELWQRLSAALSAVR